MWWVIYKISASSGLVLQEYFDNEEDARRRHQVLHTDAMYFFVSELRIFRGP